MSSPHEQHRDEPKRSSRRQFLFGGTAAGLGAAAALGANYAFSERGGPGPSPTAPPPLNGDERIPFYGVHQAGIDTDAQAHATLLGFDLLEGVDRAALRRLMSVLTDDAARLTQGRPALADSEPELALAPNRLTITFGFGPGFVARAHGAAPSWLAPLPAFSIDRLVDSWSDGDLLVQVAADDPLTVAHACRMILKDTRSFASVRWMQPGFRHAHGSVAPGTTMRNLFGQVDGTSNPAPGTADFDQVVWSTDGWLAGGTGAVIRRIHMNLDTWDHVDRVGRDQSVGRYLSNGAPLTSDPDDPAAEFDEPDFTAKTPLGFTVIPAHSHMARSRGGDPAQRIFRRAYNYELFPPGSAEPESGLLFISFQADIDRQFTPIQRRLDELDILNVWTTPIGSSVFAIPPGCSEGGYIGETLLG